MNLVSQLPVLRSFKAFDQFFNVVKAETGRQSELARARSERFAAPVQKTGQRTFQRIDNREASSHVSMLTRQFQ
jgi:hypothetical protein